MLEFITRFQASRRPHNTVNSQVLVVMIDGRKLKKLTQAAYQAMCDGAQVLEHDPYGPKVFLLGDGTILKLFRRKRLFSSALLYPYAARFERNARKLAAIGIPVPDILEIWRIPEVERDAVHYRPLPGQTLRELASQGLSSEREAHLREAFNRLVICLHDNGVYFRSLHMGNVIVGENDQLGLIDFSDIRFYPWKLNRYLRQRNLQRMLDLPAEAAWVDVAAVLSGRS